MIPAELYFRQDSTHVDKAQIFPALKTVNIKNIFGFRGTTSTRYFPKGIFPRVTSQMSQVTTSQSLVRPSEAPQSAMEVKRRAKIC